MGRNLIEQFDRNVSALDISPECRGEHAKFTEMA